MNLKNLKNLFKLQNLTRWSRMGDSLTEGAKWLNEVTLQVIHADGSLGPKQVVTNTVVNQGFNLTGKRMFDSGQGTAAPIFQKIVVGTGTGSTTTSMVELTNGSASTQEAVKDATYTKLSDVQHQLQVTFDAGSGADKITAGSNITESGIANEQVDTTHSGNRIFNRATFTAIPIGSSDSLQVTWKVTLAQGA